MKVSFLKSVQGRMKMVTVLSLVALVSVSTFLQKGATRLKDITSLQEGMQTCFTRVHNTLTSRLLNNFDSKYLMKGFTATSEECFGETISYYESLNISSGAVLEGLNTLATDVHWFHEKALNSSSENTLGGSNPENVLVSLMTNRYEKLEVKRDQVVNGLYKLKNQITMRQKTLGIVFYVIAGFVPFFILMDYLGSRRRNSVLRNVEETSKELIEDGDAHIDNVAPLVHQMLRTYNGRYLDRALEQSLANFDDNEDGVSIDQVITDDFPVKTMVSLEEADKAWESEEKLYGGKPSRSKKSDLVTPAQAVNVESVLGSVVDIVSAKIFTMGIKLNIESETVMVEAEKETLEQIFYYLLMNSISSYSYEDPNKYLSITMKRLGATLLIDFFDSGREFSKDFLKQSFGLSNKKVDQPDLAVAMSLIEDMDGKLSFENVSDDGGTRTIGRRIQVVLNVAQAKKRISRVEKGTKKEILSRMKRA